ncbi:MAG TPA: PIN domain-containing protein [Candidatus Polarisedimenticolia bacterium]|jgi:uncharacterized protein YacL|nr:PIN domain-containing protein [Candidatus Polarisedimenticolia bacterium]
MTWILRVLFILFAAVLSFQIFPPSGDSAGLRGPVLAAALAGTGLALEFLARRVEVRILAGAMLGLACGAGAGAFLWRVIPSSGLFGIPAEFLRAGNLLVALFLGAALGARKAEHFTLESLRGGGSRGAAPPDKILDTSVIIDGRIADVCETGFLDGGLVVPQFVLNELQYIADSPDPLKRNRGRKGLDILQRIQKGVHVKVVITAADFPDVKEVDLKLIELAKQTHAKILTNDFNLNKVAQLRGVEVLNVNELANSLKPVVLPGEAMKVFIIKEGKEPNQGVGYLDDGTMVVVDNAKRLIGKTVDIVVTSVLQTTAGKMFFGRFETPPGAQPEEVDRLRRNG